MSRNYLNVIRNCSLIIRQVKENVTTLVDVCFNVKNVMNVQSQRERLLPSTPYLHSTVNYLCSGKGLLQSFRFNYNYLKTHSDCYCLFHPFQVWFLLLSHVWFNFNKYSWKSRLHSSMIAPKFKHWSNKTRELLRYQSNSTSIHNRVTLIYYWQLFGLKRLFSF